MNLRWICLLKGDSVQMVHLGLPLPIKFNCAIADAFKIQSWGNQITHPDEY